VKKLAAALAALLAGSVLYAAGPEWIFYPGDFEIYLAQEVQERRLEWGGVTPVMWPQYTHHPVIEFWKGVDLAEPEDVEVTIDGVGIYTFQGAWNKAFTSKKTTWHLPAGKYTIFVRLLNSKRVPALFAKGTTLVSDSTWGVNWLDGYDKIVPSGTAGFTDVNTPPADFKLATRPEKAVSQRRTDTSSLLADFGKETFGYVVFHDVKQAGRVKIIYGESEKEALADGVADVWEEVEVPAGKTYTLPKSRAFRYVNAIPKGADFTSVSMLYEYLPLEYKGSFSCSDDLLNRIWTTSAYTLHLCTREFFLDGIKRDRWLWSGDAYQSFLMNYYLFNDDASVKRTITALRGGDPVVRHVNTILDYTHYWFNAIWDYYLYSGDGAYLKEIWPKVKTMMAFALERCDEDGFACKRGNDWSFIDWAPGPLDNEGATSFHQILFARSLESAAKCAELAGDQEAAADYVARAQALRAKVMPTFWNEEKGVLMHVRHADGKLGDQITRYANMFGLFYGYFDAKQRERAIANAVMTDDPAVMKIQTPYMRFYELEALCAAGRKKQVLDEIRSYWGGMLDLGATSFWELYNPAEKGDQHYAMYGRTYGKSFCHAWGASPIYLFGRYYLGVEPTSPGYATYDVKPDAADLAWMKGDVPTPHGRVHVEVKGDTATVTGPAKGTGTLYWKGKTYTIAPGATVTAR